MGNNEVIERFLPREILSAGRIKDPFHAMAWWLGSAHSYLPDLLSCLVGQDSGERMEEYLVIPPAVFDSRAYSYFAAGCRARVKLNSLFLEDSASEDAPVVPYTLTNLCVFLSATRCPPPPWFKSGVLGWGSHIGLLQVGPLILDQESNYGALGKSYTISSSLVCLSPYMSATNRFHLQRYPSQSCINSARVLEEFSLRRLRYLLGKGEELRPYLTGHFLRLEGEDLSLLMSHGSPELLQGYDLYKKYQEYRVGLPPGTYTWPVVNL